MTIGPAEEGCWTLSASDMVYAKGLRMALSQEHCAREEIPSQQGILAVGVSSIYDKQTQLCLQKYA